MKTINFLVKGMLLLSLVGCSGEPPVEYSVIRLPGPTAHSASSPRLSSGPGDELILSWLQPGEDDSATAALRFARLTDKAWTGARTVIEADKLFVNWADLPSVVPLVKLAVSTDSGKSFSAPLEVVRGETLGRVAVELLQNNDVAVSWLAPAEAGTYAVQTRRLSADGSTGPVRLIAYASALSVPQMARQGTQLVFAWTEPSVDGSRIATAVVNIGAL